MCAVCSIFGASCMESLMHHKRYLLCVVGEGFATSRGICLVRREGRDGFGASRVTALVQCERRLGCVMKDYDFEFSARASFLRRERRLKCVARDDFGAS